jgi:hypothetical protein
MNTRKTLLKCCAIAFATLLLAGCKKKAEGDAGSAPQRLQVSDNWPAGTGSAHVQYQSNVKVMEQSEGEAAIIGQSSNGAALLFNGANAQTRQLQAGDVLLVKGLLARKVLAVEAESEGTLVLTQQATIPEVVEGGTIDVAAPIRFGSLRAENDASDPYPFSQSLNWIRPTPVHAQIGDAASLGKAEAQGSKDAYGNMVKGAVSSVLEGWETTFKATPAGGKLNLDLTLTKNVDDFAAKITGQGYIANFQFHTGIGVQQSTMQKLEAEVKNINGVMNFQWEVAKKSPGPHSEDDRIKLPAAVTIPLAQYLGGMPLFLEISSAIIIKPEIAGAELSKGSFRITYNGYQGFQTKEGNIDGNGNVSGNIEFSEPLNVAPAAPMGLVVAFAAPRIELSFGVSKVFKMDDIKVAAERVDALADQAAKKLLDADQYEAFKNGPLGRFQLAKAAENALQSDAAAYFEMVTSSGMSYSGMSVLTPCSRQDITLLGVVGASAQAFGESLGESRKEIFKKQLTKIDPPGTKLCKDLVNDSTS